VDAGFEIAEEGGEAVGVDEVEEQAARVEDIG
jgi:hypothetical protein